MHSALRREWDSNPRYPYGHTRSPGVPVQPLLHLSFESFTSPPTSVPRKLSVQPRSARPGLEKRFPCSRSGQIWEFLRVDQDPRDTALRISIPSLVVLRQATGRVIRASDVAFSELLAPEHVHVEHAFPSEWDSPPARRATSWRRIRRPPYEWRTSWRRTHGTLTGTHALQACQFNHSCISPKIASLEK
jgi:hypothetical protein